MIESVNVWAVVAATIAMFAVGAVWYTFIFQDQWSRIHGFDKLSKKEQEAMMSQMAPLYGAQLLVTIISAFVLAYLMHLLPNLAPATVAGLVWLGFVLPAQVSGVIFGGTESKYVLQKIAILSSEALLHLVIAACIIGLFR